MSSVLGAAVTIKTGLEFAYEQGVDASLARIASLTAPKKALADEGPKLLASAKKEVPKAPYFIKPAKGIDWGIIHANNGVDIANDCGTRIVAAAAGTVTEVGSGWNGGYGNAVAIKHKNGTTTYYAHLDTVGVEVGDKLVQGDLVGTMGETGKATGCHLHFEVHGGKNPFGK